MFFAVGRFEFHVGPRLLFRAGITVDAVCIGFGKMLSEHPFMKNAVQTGEATSVSVIGYPL
jgi:hypothetical protein